MKEDNQFEKPTVSAYFRHRSPTFTKEEVKALLNIVRKYKSIVFNKSTSAAASYAKEATWVKIAKAFNSRGFTHLRSADCLKIKWDNLKKEARKLSKNLMDIKDCDLDDVTNQMVAMMAEAENSTSSMQEPVDSEGDQLDSEEPKDTPEFPWNDNEQRGLDDSLDGDVTERLLNRSLNFTPKECGLLLECVRQEKKIILSKANSATANKIKSKAWSRITNSYNKLSPQKRSTKVLRTKFTNMKRLAKNITLKDYLKDLTRKHEPAQDTNHSVKQIKSEPLFDQYRRKQDADEIDDADDRSLSNQQNATLDPLCTVLNADFGIGSISQYENKEIVKLKTELLNYQLETAKLQRKRIEDFLAADAAERESKALETSLKLRAARLESIAAEMKFPPAHPALAYTADETRAQHYITQMYHTT